MKKVFLVFALSLISFLPQKVEAAIAWDWQFTNDFISVSPTDQVIQKIRVFNNSTAGETLGVFGSGTPNFWMDGMTIGGVGGYTPSALLFSQFGSPLAAGSSRDVNFVAYTPAGAAADGHYFTGGQLIQISTGGSFFGGLSRCFNWRVNSDASDACPNSPNFEEQTSGGGGTEIPEPSTVLLMMFGLGSLVLRSFKKFNR